MSIKDDPLTALGLETMEFHVEELGWQCVNRAENIWEAPNGELRIFPTDTDPIVLCARTIKNG